MYFNRRTAETLTSKKHKMGSSKSKFLSIIEDPNQREELQSAFQQLDKDGNGSLDQEEFKLLGRYLYASNVDGATNEVREEVREEFQNKAPFLAKLMGKAASSATDLLAKQISPADVDEWIEKMFVVADKNGDSGISFEEFEDFLKTDAKHDKEARKASIRDAVADNMEANNGGLNVTVKEGNVTKSVTVNVPGVSSSDIRKEDKN